uniref:Uncharacterized protein n=1 Tax=Rhizophora mucronata TaxID=61149 RepID=A0A2P2PKT6_RHIMU
MGVFSLISLGNCGAVKFC